MSQSVIEQSRAVTQRMLAGRLLQLVLLPLALLLCQETEEVEVEVAPSDTPAPVAAALVSGENSDLGKS